MTRHSYPRFTALWASLSFFVLGASVAVIGYLSFEHRVHPAMERATNEQSNEIQSERDWDERRATELNAMFCDPATGKIPENIKSLELAFVRSLPTVEGLATIRKNNGGGSLQASTWISQGPTNLSGRTRAVAYDITRPQTLIAGGVSGGIWRSANAGQSWQRVTPPDGIPGVTCLVQDTRSGKQQMWYCGTGENIGSASIFQGTGIHVSNDSGKTWVQMPSTRNSPDFRNIYAIAIQPKEDTHTVLYVATNKGIFRSGDGGNTWTKTLAPASTFTGDVRSNVAITNDGHVIAVIGSHPTLTRGVFVLPYLPNSLWTNVTPQDWYKHSIEFTRIAIAPSNQQKFYLLGIYNDTLAHAFYQANMTLRGTPPIQTLYVFWENRGGNLPGKIVIGNLTFPEFNTQYGYSAALAVAPNNDSTVFLGGVWSYRSDNAFATTTATVIMADGGVDHHAYIFPSSPGPLPGRLAMISANDQGLSRVQAPFTASYFPISPNAPPSQQIDTGYVTTQFFTVALDKEPNNRAIIGGMQDNSTFMIPNIQATTKIWKPIGGSDGLWCALSSKARIAYSSNQLGEIYKDTIDANANRVGNFPFLRIDPLHLGLPLPIQQRYILDPEDENKMYFVGTKSDGSNSSSVWRHNNLSAIKFGQAYNRVDGWTKLADIPPNAGRASAIDASQTLKRLYVGTDKGKVYRIDNAQGATPSIVDVTGVNFPQPTTTTPSIAPSVSCVTVDPTNSNRAFVVFSNYNVQSVFYTINGGSNWTPVGGNLEENPDGSGNGPACTWLSILNVQGTLVYYLGTTSGLFVTTQLNGANTVWLREAVNEIGTGYVAMIATRHADGMVAVATHGMGMFSTTVTSPQVFTLAAPGSGSSSLSQESLISLTRASNRCQIDAPYPNPFQESIGLRYELREAAVVSVQVSDLAGNILYTNTAPKRAGRHEVQWGEYITKHSTSFSMSYYYTAKVRFQDGSEVSKSGMISRKY